MTNHNTKYNPPKLMMIFLEWFCSKKHIEEVSGDLIELFLLRTRNISDTKNRILFFFDVLKFFRPRFWKKRFFNLDGGLIMLHSYIKFAFRNFTKHAFNSAINVIGLTVGIASFLYIFTFIYSELSYDKHIKNYEDIYRVITDGSFNGELLQNPFSSKLATHKLTGQIPEIEAYTQITPFHNYTVTYKKNTIKELNVCSADSNFSKIFQSKMIFGPNELSLKIPDEIYLAKSVSIKLFGDKNPVGEIINLDFKTDHMIAGVFEDFPLNTHFKPKIIIAANLYAEDNWTDRGIVLYLRLNKKSNIAEIQNKIDKINMAELSKDFVKFEIDIDQFYESGNKYNLTLQKLTDIHLDSDLTGDFEENGDYQYVQIFGIIGLFILILAAVNFVNLSTARSSLRAKEVGIKKVVGSTKTELINQFLTESVLISFMSFLLAVIIISIFFDSINLYTGINFENLMFSNYIILPSVFIVVFISGIIAGSFPAFILSSFAPIKVLKNTFNKSSKSKMRNGLVIFQFTTSMILIVGTLVVFDQLEFIQNQKLGYDKEQLLIVEDAYIAKKNLNSFYEKVKTHNDVINGTISGFLPVGEYRQSNGVFPDGNKNDRRMTSMENWNVDYDYIPTLDLKIVEGRNFDKNYSTDTKAVIINQACVKHFGFEKPLEHQLAMGGSGHVFPNYNIIGVVEDFNYESLKESIKPLIMKIGNHDGYVTFKIKGDIKETIKYIESTWEEMVPGKSFSYKFLDESFNNLYFSEVRTGKLFGLFAIFAILIASLGLLGLVAFTVERKTKEIGIRKVMGASTSNVMLLMIKEFVLLVIVAIIIAVPISYYVLGLWLNNYAYRTDLSFGIFLLGGTLSLSIAICTVVFHSFKASNLNPIDTIKNE